NLMSTYEYQKETIRGGPSILSDTAVKKEGSQTGLDKEYVFEYSFSITEPLVMMIPRMYGGSSDSRDLDQEKSKTIESLQRIGQQNLEQVSQQTGIYLPNFIRTYWGGLGGVGTSGPPYVGAIICFLAIISFFVLDGKHKWWALAAIIFTVMMSWGSYFKGFNYFLFDTFPFYNKFRAPSMVLVIPQLLLPMLAVLGVNAYVKAPDKKALWPAFKKGLIATGIVFVILFLMYFSFDFMSQRDSDLLKQVRNAGQPQLYDIFKSFFDGLKADRKGLFMGDIWRSLGLILIAAFILFLLVKNKINTVLASLLLALFVLIDLITVDSKYLNKENYQDEIENTASFTKTPMDEAILADTSFYRVFNISGNAYSESTTSYHFNSIGGYHPAKLRLYQDIIERRLSLEQNKLIQMLQTRPDSIGGVNTPTLNMLNAKYFIYKENDQTKAQWLNVNALGNCWFVQQIRYVKNADAEMAALGEIDPRTTAVIQESHKASVPFEPQPDSAASIVLIKNDNDVIRYSSNSATNQFAVFSEVYYRAGWKAFIDGKEAPIVKTNYILRGLAIPAGKHLIEFRFEPEGYLKGKSLTTIFTIALVVLLAAGIFMEWRNRKSDAPAMT
ncbi:MAG TPA: YfhO family protein, partial [Chitinophagaceae bacterium]|nr:YfhO family protein [Chitinophagaceae bacterium]